MLKFKLIIAIIIILIVSAIAIFLIRLRSAQNTGTVDREFTSITSSINLRSYLTMTPIVSPVSQVIDGKFFVFSMENVPTDHQVEYEILYETSNVQEGIFGIVDSSPNYTKEWFFGTKSTGDYRFHQGVEFGEVTTRFTSDQNEYEIVSNFRLQKIGPKAVTLSDKKETYSLELPAAAVSKNSYAISHKTSGLPQKYSGVFLVDQPIGFFSQGIVSLAKEATLKIRTDKNSSGEVIILGFNPTKKEWVEFPTEFDPETVSATTQVNLLTSYIVIEKSAAE